MIDVKLSKYETEITRDIVSQIKAKNPELAGDLGDEWMFKMTGAIIKRIGEEFSKLVAKRVKKFMSEEIKKWD